MVELSRSIANKIKDKQGDITEDEVRGYKQKELKANRKSLPSSGIKFLVQMQQTLNCIRMMRREKCREGREQFII